MRLPSASVCTPIDADQIFAGDLARANPEFSKAPADANIGYSPAPGSRRVFHIDELRRLALRFQVDLSVDREACFEWPLAPITQDQAVAAMKLSVPVPDARIDVVEMSKRATPHGEVVFPLSGLIPPADKHGGVALWRGYVVYAGDRRFDVWARVQISAPMSRVVALAPIPSGNIIAKTDVRLETVNEFPITNDAAANLDEVVGRVSRFGLAAGHILLRSELSEAIDVKAGDLVEVQVKFGHAHLKLQALAESSGHRGDIIALQNPKSGKTFRARVESEGKVIIVP